MPYGSLTAAKEGGFLTKLDDVALTLAQVNAIARQYDAVKAEGSADSAMAVAISNFKKTHKKNDDGTAWVAKKVAEAMTKEPWELTVDDLPAAFREYPKLAKDTALSFFRTALDGGFTPDESAEIALAAVGKKWQKDGDGWKYTGEAIETPEVRLTGDVLRESAIVETIPFDGGGFEIREAEDGFKRIIGPLLAVGFSKNKGKITESHVESRRGKYYPRYYSEAELKRLAPLCEGLTLYVGFDEHNDQVDVPKELGRWQNSHFAAGAIRGEAKVFHDQDWVVDRLKCHPTAFGGFSIEGNAGHVHGYVDGVEAAITKNTTVKCARLVKNPAAAGPIEGIQESEIKTRKGGERMKLADLNESERDDVMREAKGIVEAEQGVKVKDAKIAELTEAMKVKDAEIAKLGEAVNAQKSRDLIEAAMPKDKDGKHVLSEAARAKLHKDLKGEVDEAKIKEAVKDLADILTEATGAGKPVGAGMSAPASSGETVKESQQLCDNLMGVVEPEPPKP